METKICYKCGLEKPTSYFQIRTDTGKLRGDCRDCRSADNLTRYHVRSETRERHREASRRSACKKYGITEDILDSMLSTQDHKCAICDAPLIKRGDKSRIMMIACIDHDHSNGRVRGLLCRNCNSGLGKFRDNIDFMKQAIIYLEKSK